MPRDLTKSRYLAGLRCPRLLWTRWNRPDDVPPPPDDRRPIIESGRQVERLAQRVFPGAIEVPRLENVHEAVQATAKLLEQRVPLLEAAFSVSGRHCRVDVLLPAPDEHWDLIEIKAGAKVRENHIRDLAFQYDTLGRAGLEIDRVYVVHLNSGYVRRGEIDIMQLFTRVDVTDRVVKLATYTDRTIQAMQEMVAGPDPDTPIGSRCNAPHPCPLKPLCWGDLPADNVTLLYHGGQRIWELMDSGIFAMAQVPDKRLSARQLLQKQALATGEPHVDRDALHGWLDELVYPVHHLDFETMAPAVPAFDGVRPYQQIPFQFSLHIQHTPGAEPEHHEFLATEPGDPRPHLVDALLQAIGPTGTVLAWNMAFEKLVIEELAEADLVRAPRLIDLAKRLVDLMTPFTAFMVHHPDQGGSCSLKAVLPAVTDLGYDDLQISAGGAATHGYEQAMFGGIEPAARSRILADLRAYCGRDTEAMIAILGWLGRSAEGPGTTLPPG